jgi:hypothetical protein
MSSLTILLIRHAEKPDHPHDVSIGPGLTAAGEVDKHSLTVRGWQRAGAWSALFGTGLGAADFPRPDAIYAADPHRPADDDDSVSRRPWETIVPLSARLRLTPVTRFGVGDEKAMLDDARALTGVALICWEHKKIADVILPELANGQSIPRLPRQWDGARFDVRFDRSRNSAPWSFRQLLPRLLSGDSDVPL